jgi:hypothetical protein
LSNSAIGIKLQDYANGQADLLLAVDRLRRLPLEEMAEHADALGMLSLGEMARRARAMCNCGPHGAPKAIRSETPEATRRTGS